MGARSQKKILIFLYIIIIISAIYLYFSYRYYNQVEGFESPKLENERPKNIWVYWDYENPPKIVTQIYEHHKRTLKSWDIELLNNKTIHKYIKKEDFPSKYNDIMVQAQSDWIRLYLLKKYGGLWMDSTIIINDENELNNIYNKSYKMKSEFTGFSYNSDIKDNILTYIENWFIMCPQNSSLISKWYTEFSRAIDINFMNYKKELKRDKIYIDNRIYNLDDDNVYFTMHACLQKILRTDHNYKPSMIINKAEESAFKLMISCDWKSPCIKQKMENDPSIKKYWIIKFIGSIRKEIDDLSFYFK
jgi:hypothetical protein